MALEAVESPVAGVPAVVVELQPAGGLYADAVIAVAVGSL